MASKGQGRGGKGDLTSARSKAAARRLAKLAAGGSWQSWAGAGQGDGGQAGLGLTSAWAKATTTTTESQLDRDRPG